MNDDKTAPTCEFCDQRIIRDPKDGRWFHDDLTGTTFCGEHDQIHPGPAEVATLQHNSPETPVHATKVTNAGKSSEVATQSGITQELAERLEAWAYVRDEEDAEFPDAEKRERTRLLRDAVATLRCGIAPEPGSLAATERSVRFDFYEAANILAAVRAYPDTGDWHAQARYKLEPIAGDWKPNPRSGITPGLADRLEEMAKPLDAEIDRGGSPQKWEEARTLRAAATALRSGITPDLTYIRALPARWRLAAEGKEWNDAHDRCAEELQRAITAALSGITPSGDRKAWWTRFRALDRVRIPKYGIVVELSADQADRANDDPEQYALVTRACTPDEMDSFMAGAAASAPTLPSRIAALKIDSVPADHGKQSLRAAHAWNQAIDAVLALLSTKEASR